MVADMLTWGLLQGAALPEFDIYTFLYVSHQNKLETVRGIGFVDLLTDLPEAALDVQRPPHSEPTWGAAR